MTPSSAQKIDSRSINALEGWRGIACLLVVTYHCGLNLRVPLVTIFGSVGVHMFFVLSGYLLFSPYASAMLEQRRLPSQINFYHRRFLRIMPPYLVSLAAFSLLRFLTGTKPPSGLNMVTHALLVFNYVPWIDIFSINPVFWSLAVEVQFYVLLPLMCVAVSKVLSGKHGRAAAVICVGMMFGLGVAARSLEVRSFAKGAAITGPQEDVAYRTVFSYLDLFACGMAVACLPALGPGPGRAGRPWLRTGIAAIGITAVIAANDWSAAVTGGAWLRGGSNRFLILFPIIVGVGFAALLWTITATRGPGPTWLARGPLPWIGLISYSLYLYHVGVEFAAERLHLFDGRTYLFQSVANTLLTTPLALAVAVVMYLAVERPSLRWVSKVRSKTRPGSDVAGAPVGDSSVVLLGP